MPSMGSDILSLLFESFTVFFASCPSCFWQLQLCFLQAQLCVLRICNIIVCFALVKYAALLRVVVLVHVWDWSISLSAYRQVCSLSLISLQSNPQLFTPTTKKLCSIRLADLSNITFSTFKSSAEVFQ